MAFLKTLWADRQAPKVSGAQLNRIEQGVADAHAWIADPWHNIGTAGEPAFLNAWVNYGGTFENAAFRLILPGVVAFKGSVKAGNYGTAIFSVPAPYRPIAQRRLTVNCFDSGTRRVALLYVQPDGGVYAFSETGVVNPATEFDMEALMVI